VSAFKVRLKRWHTSTPFPHSVCSSPRPRFEGPSFPGSESGDVPGTAKCLEPLRPRWGVTPPGEDLAGLLRGHYPTLIATTSSRANPLCSVGLWSPSCLRSLRVAASPRCTADLPDIISANLSSRAWTSTPAASRVLTRFFPQSIGLPPLGTGSALGNHPTTTSVGEEISELQSFATYIPHITGRISA